MNMEFQRKLPIPKEIKEQFPLSAESEKIKKLKKVKKISKKVLTNGLYCGIITKLSQRAATKAVERSFGH